MPAACGGDAQHFLRLALLDIFRREEARKIATYNLFGFIAFDSFGTGIPTEDLALRVHHKYRVVLYAVEKHLVFFFAGLQRDICAPIALRGPDRRCDYHQPPGISQHQSSFRQARTAKVGEGNTDEQGQ